MSALLIKVKVKFDDGALDSFDRFNAMVCDDEEKAFRIIFMLTTFSNPFLIRFNKKKEEWKAARSRWVNYNLWKRIQLPQREMFSDYTKIMRFA
ncbi:CLUMA_CG010111, isoform A [Clunio marinus]|uniref:CLUMA_CG010111, isoform A n=1 Tax=Clunio marinus TaxID=568069 RepID=A0A1J1I8K1_9DIPT|nr:CLUMA_CG010111, isoform A [Clunio marinus]